jgi:hypothetical protein
MPIVGWLVLVAVLAIVILVVVLRLAAIRAVLKQLGGRDE